METIRMRSSKTTMLTLWRITNPRNRSKERRRDEFLKNSVDVVQFFSLGCFTLFVPVQKPMHQAMSHQQQSQQQQQTNKTFFFSFHPSFISLFLRCLVFYVRLFVTSLTADIRTFRVDWRDNSLHLCCNSFSFFNDLIFFIHVIITSSSSPLLSRPPLVCRSACFVLCIN